MNKTLVEILKTGKLKLPAGFSAEGPLAIIALFVIAVLLLWP